MSPVLSDQKITPDDLLAMPDGESFELVNGQLVEREMGFKSSRIGGELFGHEIVLRCETSRVGIARRRGISLLL